VLNIVVKMFGFGKAKDPVCGMSVEKKKAIKRIVGGVEYYFCSEHCANEFENKHGGSVELEEDELHSHGGHRGHHHTGCC
jgi:YHS domain-containing protein